MSLLELKDLPVDWRDDSIQGEGSWVSLVLANDGVSQTMLAILWCSNSIQDADNDDQKPTDDSQDLVGPESLCVVAFSAREGVCCKEVGWLA